MKIIRFKCENFKKCGVVGSCDLENTTYKKAILSIKRHRCNHCDSKFVIEKAKNEN